MTSSSMVAAATAAYIALAVAALRRARHQAHPASARLGVVFACLGGIGTAFVAAEGLDSAVVLQQCLLVVGFGGLLAYPVVLLWFVDGMEPVRATARAAVSVLSVVLAVLVSGQVVGVAFPASVRSTVDVLLVVFAATWMLTHVIAARSLWAAGRRLRSALARRRAIAMTVGIGTLGGLFVVPAVVPYADWNAAIVLGVFAAGCLWLGFAPPRAIRLAWSQPDVEAMAAAEERLLRTGDIDVVATDLLPAVCRLLDGEAAWFTEGEALLALHGTSVTTLQNVHARLGHGSTTRSVEVLRLEDDRWLIAAPSGAGWLVVRTSDEPVMFGAGDSTVLKAVAVRTTLVIRRAEIDLREQESARRLRETQHLQEVARVKDDVLSTLSHELRTPLVTIGGASELLVARWDALTDEQKLAFVQRIEVNARDLTGLVVDTLQLASLRAGGARPAAHPAHVGQLVAGIAAGLAPQHRTRVRIDADVALETDPEQLTALLRQLVDNALKFSHDAIDVVAVQAVGFTRISVTDRGAGMRPAELSQVRQPMFRGGELLVRETRGLGIGLTLAHTLADVLGGTLALTSDGHTGTVATVNLPTFRGHDGPREVGSLRTA